MNSKLFEEELLSIKGSFKNNLIFLQEMSLGIILKFIFSKILKSVDCADINKNIKNQPASLFL